MSKKWIAWFIIFSIVISNVGYGKMEVQAEEVETDFSYLMTDEALLGTMEAGTRGIYLAEGNSIINKAASNKIGAGGNTVAALKCKVAVTPIVERLVNGSWARVTSWNVTTESGFLAVASKTITVGTGYYYRVRCSHYAASDVSSSGTDALWMGN